MTKGLGKASRLLRLAIQGDNFTLSMRQDMVTTSTNHQTRQGITMSLKHSSKDFLLASEPLTTGVSGGYLVKDAEGKDIGFNEGAYRLWLWCRQD